jgi:hypothetical protein
MAATHSRDHPVARATIIAALIGLLGSIISGLLGNRVGERRASEEVQGLEARMQQQEHSVQALQAQLSERDQAIRELTDQVARERARASAALRSSANGAAAPTAISEGSQEPAQPDQATIVERDDVISVKRLPPVDISLEKCEHWGGGLSCRLLLTNTGSAAANVALGDRSTFAYDEHGNEYRLQRATLGSKKWSAAQFGAIRLEPGIPVAAKFQFDGLPESARRGPLRLVLAVVPIAGPQAFLGPNPRWQSIVFEDVPFG